MTVLLLAGIAMGACSLTVDADRTQCSSNADCTARGGDFSDSRCVQSICQAQSTPVPADDGGQIPETEWGCLGKGMKPEVPGTPPYKVAMKFSGVISQKPVTGITGKLCKKLDGECEAPTETEATNDDGILTFTNVAGGFNGFMTFEGGGSYPGLYFFSPNVNGPREDPPLAVQVVTPADVALLTGTFLKKPQQAGKGLALINVVNCLNKSATGVHYRTDSVAEGKTTSYFYAVGGVPAPDATVTDVSGFAGIINADPGAVTMEAVIDLDGEERHIGTIGFLIKADAITYMKIIPDAN